MSKDIILHTKCEKPYQLFMEEMIMSREPKEKILRGNFDDMKLEEAENVAQYGVRMKEVVSAIRSLGGQLQEETVSRKYMRTLLPIYAIRVSAI